MTVRRSIPLALFFAVVGCSSSDDDEPGPCCEGELVAGGPRVSYECGETFCHEGQLYECQAGGHAEPIADECGAGDGDADADADADADVDGDGDADAGTRSDLQGVWLGGNALSFGSDEVYVSVRDGVIERMQAPIEIDLGFSGTCSTWLLAAEDIAIGADGTFVGELTILGSDVTLEASGEFVATALGVSYGGGQGGALVCGDKAILGDYEVDSGSFEALKRATEGAPRLEILETFEAPGYDPQGLATDGSTLWMADESSETIFVLSLSGEVEDSFPSPGPSPTGLVFDGTNLWCADRTDNAIHQIDTSGRLLGSVPVPVDEWVKGLTYDGQSLWVIAYEGLEQAYVYEIDPDTGTVLGSFETTSGNSQEGITFAGTHFWQSDIVYVYKIDLEGELLTFFPEPVPRASHLLYDDTYLWIVDSTNEMIHKLALD